MNGLGQHIAQLGWSWTKTHALVALAYNGQVYRVAVPVQRVNNAFASELKSVGCPLATCGVGAPLTVGGFFKKLKRAVRKASQKVRKAIPKGIRKAAKRVWRAASKVVQKALKITRSLVQSPILKGLLIAASAIPGAAVVTAPALVAVQAADSIDRAVSKGEKAAKAISNGVKSAKLLAEKRAGQKAIDQLRKLSQRAQRGDRRAAETVSAFRQKLN